MSKRHLKKNFFYGVEQNLVQPQRIKNAVLQNRHLCLKKFLQKVPLEPAAKQYVSTVNYRIFHAVRRSGV